MPRSRARLLFVLGCGVLVAAASACGACGKREGVDPNLAAQALDAAQMNRVTTAPDAGVVAERNVAMWTAAREGSTDELASLATHEGAAGLVEAAAEPQLRPTAIRAMAFARGWAQLPYLTKLALGSEDEEAKLVLESIVELAARPRKQDDPEDADELVQGCKDLTGLAKDSAKEKDRRIGALRALRMMPCSGRADLPADLDAK